MPVKKTTIPRFLKIHTMLLLALPLLFTGCASSNPNPDGPLTGPEFGIYFYFYNYSSDPVNFRSQNVEQGVPVHDLNGQTIPPYVHAQNGMGNDDCVGKKMNHPYKFNHFVGPDHSNAKGWISFTVGGTASYTIHGYCPTEGSNTAQLDVSGSNTDRYNIIWGCSNGYDFKIGECPSSLEPISIVIAIVDTGKKYCPKDALDLLRKLQPQDATAVLRIPREELLPAR